MAEYILFTEGRYTLQGAPNSDLEFGSDTPFSDALGIDPIGGESDGFDTE